MPTREDDDDRRPSLADAANGFGPPGIGEAQVEDDDIGLERGNELERLRPVPGALRLEAPHLEQVSERFALLAIVVDYDNALCRGCHRTRSSLHPPPGGEGSGDALSRPVPLAHRIAALGLPFRRR